DAGPGYIDIAVLAGSKGARAGTVLLRAVAEPPERRFARYAGLILLVTMGALVIAVLGFAQAQLSRRAGQLANVNQRLQQEMVERRKTEEALRQSHKMEAIGQLTGGIAHDFNNLLQGITGALNMVQKRIGEGRIGEVDRFVKGALSSAERASALTHRLLAFSRLQPVDPRPVNMNQLIGTMEE